MRVVMSLKKQRSKPRNTPDVIYKMLLGQNFFFFEDAKPWTECFQFWHLKLDLTLMGLKIVLKCWTWNLEPFNQKNFYSKLQTISFQNCKQRGLSPIFNHTKQSLWGSSVPRLTGRVGTLLGKRRRRTTPRTLTRCSPRGRTSSSSSKQLSMLSPGQNPRYLFSR